MSDCFVIGPLFFKNLFLCPLIACSARLVDLQKNTLFTITSSSLLVDLSTLYVSSLSFSLVPSLSISFPLSSISLSVSFHFHSLCSLYYVFLSLTSLYQSLISFFSLSVYVLLLHACICLSLFASTHYIYPHLLPNLSSLSLSNYQSL